MVTKIITDMTNNTKVCNMPSASLRYRLWLNGSSYQLSSIISKHTMTTNNLDKWIFSEIIEPSQTIICKKEVS